MTGASWETHPGPIAAIIKYMGMGQLNLFFSYGLIGLAESPSQETIDISASFSDKLERRRGRETCKGSPPSPSPTQFHLCLALSSLGAQGAAGRKEGEPGAEVVPLGVHAMVLMKFPPLPLHSTPYTKANLRKSQITHRRSPPSPESQWPQETPSTQLSSKGSQTSVST